MKKYLLVLGTVLTVFVSSCTLPGYTAATGNNSGKESEVVYRAFLNIRLKSWDLSVASCAKKAGITKVATVDYDLRQGLFITRYRLRITGE
jgi:hypothetical protein